MPAIDYLEAGAGPTLLFVPGSFSTPAAWRALQKSLPPAYRMVGTSLCGYGATDDTRTLEDCGMAHEVRVVEAAARRAGGPVHLVGHSFGGTVALATALAGSVEVASLALFEANPLALIADGGRPDLYRQTEEMSRGFAAALAAGEPEAAAIVIDFWGGPGSFAAFPEAVRAYCRERAPANRLDWLTDFGFPALRSDYAALAMPVLLVRGALANPAMVVMTDALRACLPAARSAVVAEAGHFLVSSHPAACAALLAEFLAEVASP